MANQSANKLGVDNARAQTRLVRRLKEIRQSRGMSAIEVAESIGVDESMIYRFEKGGTNFTMSTLRKYAKAVGASLKLDATSPPTPEVEVSSITEKRPSGTFHAVFRSAPPQSRPHSASWTAGPVMDDTAYHPQKFTIEELGTRHSVRPSKEADSYS